MALCAFNKENAVKTFIIFNTNTPEEDTLKVDLREEYDISYTVGI